MNNKRIFSYQKYEVEVELSNGDKADIILREMTIPETEEFFSLMINAAFRQAIITGQVHSKGKDITDKDKFIIADIADNPNNLIFTLIPHVRAWEIITGRKDLSWLNLVSASDLVRILDLFIEINPLYEQKKKDFEMLLKVSNMSAATVM